MDVKKVGEFIKKKRKEKNLTQKELAERLSITDRAISKWERGICCPDISLLKELSSILDISVNELLSGGDIDKLEMEQSENILVETVKKYTLVEKKKNKKLLIITIILLIFYVGLVWAMYLTFNQVNKNDKVSWETLHNIIVMEKFYNALENYDYEYFKKYEKNTMGYDENLVIEDENKCEEYKNNGEEWGLICRLKDLENLGVEFVSHEFYNQYYSKPYFVVDYSLVVRYKENDSAIIFSSTIHNDTIIEMLPGWSNRESDSGIKDFDILNKLVFLFDYSSSYPK